jgi:hypothetical protein
MTAHIHYGNAGPSATQHHSDANELAADQLIQLLSTAQHTNRKTSNLNCIAAMHTS